MLYYPRLPKWNDVLLEIYRSPEGNRYCEKLNRRVRGSLTHLRDVVKMLAEHGLITIAPANNVKKLVLTEKGERVAMHLSEVRGELGTDLKSREKEQSRDLLT